MLPYKLFQDVSAKCEQSQELKEGEDETAQYDEMTEAQAERNQIKQGKAVKVALSEFKLKTVLGRGGYGKVMIN